MDIVDKLKADAFECGAYSAICWSDFAAIMWSDDHELRTLGMSREDYEWQLKAAYYELNLNRPGTA